MGDAGFTGALRESVQVATEMVRILAGLSDQTGEFSAKAEQVLGVLKGLGVTLAAITALRVVQHFRKMALVRLRRSMYQ